MVMVLTSPSTTTELFRYPKPLKTQVWRSDRLTGPWFGDRQVKDKHQLLNLPNRALDGVRVLVSPKEVFQRLDDTVAQSFV